MAKTPSEIEFEIDGLVYKELKKLGITDEEDIESFLRGAIWGGIVNAKRSKDKKWQKLFKEIQPLVRKHLGIGLTLDSARDIVEAGRIEED